MAVKVNQNYPTPNFLLAEDEDSVPLQYVHIRIFERTEFDAGNIDVWEAETLTNIDGKWVNPVYLDEGYEWVVEFSRATTHETVYVDITTVVP